MLLIAVMGIVRGMIMGHGLASASVGVTGGNGNAGARPILRLLLLDIVPH